MAHEHVNRLSGLTRRTVQNEIKSWIPRPKFDLDTFFAVAGMTIGAGAAFEFVNLYREAMANPASSAAAWFGKDALNILPPVAPLIPRPDAGIVDFTPTKLSPTATHITPTSTEISPTPKPTETPTPIATATATKEPTRTPTQPRPTSRPTNRPTQVIVPTATSVPPEAQPTRNPDIPDGWPNDSIENPPGSGGWFTPLSSTIPIQCVVNKVTDTYDFSDNGNGPKAYRCEGVKKYPGEASLLIFNGN